MARYIELTSSNGAGVENLATADLIYVEEEGSGSKVTYAQSEGGLRNSVIVDETPATITTNAGNLIVFVTADGDVRLNADRIKSTFANESSLARVRYNSNGMGEDVIDSTENVAAVLAKIDAL